LIRNRTPKKRNKKGVRAEADEGRKFIISKTKTSKSMIDKTFLLSLKIRFSSSSSVFRYYFFFVSFKHKEQ